MEGRWPKPGLERAARGTMRAEPVVFGDAAREMVDRAIRDHAAHTPIGARYFSDLSTINE